MSSSSGVIVSRSAHLLVETTSGSSGSDSDADLDRFQAEWGGVLVPGRITVTRLHVTFVPRGAGRATAMLTLRLRDIHGVEVAGGRVSQTLGVRTDSHLVHLRMLGARGVADEVDRLARAARASPRRAR